jgi:hypothetical protein
VHDNDDGLICRGALVGQQPLKTFAAVTTEIAKWITAKRRRPVDAGNDAPLGLGIVFLGVRTPAECSLDDDR